MQTEFANIASLTLKVGQEPSPRQKELKDVTKTVTKIALGAGLVFFFLAVLLAGMRPARRLHFRHRHDRCFVPEGLLRTLTLALAMVV